MLHSIYHMPLKLFKNRIFAIKNGDFAALNTKLKRTSRHNVTKSVNLNFIA